jgi:hypothetical protein
MPTRHNERNDHYTRNFMIPGTRSRRTLGKVHRLISKESLAEDHTKGSGARSKWGKGKEEYEHQGNTYIFNAHICVCQVHWCSSVPAHTDYVP